MTIFGLLSLFIDNEKVDEVRVFSEDETNRAVKSLKEFHNIVDTDDYDFILIFQSKMNGRKRADIS